MRELTVMEIEQVSGGHRSCRSSVGFNAAAIGAGAGLVIGASLGMAFSGPVGAVVGGGLGYMTGIYIGAIVGAAME